MKNNKGFIGIGLMIAILAALILSSGAIYYVTKPSTSNTSIPTTEVKDVSVVPTQNEVSKNETNKTIPVDNLREYKNTEAGFSFKYPAIYGEVTITKDSPDQIGFIYQGLAGTPGKYYFQFNFATKDFVVGDTDPTAKNEFNPCEQTGVSCEQILSKGGTELQLATNLNPGSSESYSLYVPLSSNINYKDLVFISSNRLVLVNLAAQLEVSK